MECDRSQQPHPTAKPQITKSMRIATVTSSANIMLSSRGDADVNASALPVDSGEVAFRLGGGD